MPINLLPKDLSVSAPLVKTAALLRNLITLGFAVFVIVAIGFVAFFIINSLSLSNSLRTQAELETSIKSLEQTEQGLVLVKDRLTKINQLQVGESAKEESENLSRIFSQAAQIGTLGEAVLEKDKLDTTFSVTSSTALSRLLASVVSAENYQRIELLSFSFNPNSGYLVSLSFVTK